PRSRIDNQRGGEWDIVRRNTANSGALACGVVRVDLCGRDIPVPVQIPVVANAAGAVLNRILLAIGLDWAEVRPIAGCQREITARKLARAGNLPSADKRIQQFARIVGQEL